KVPKPSPKTGITRCITGNEKLHDDVTRAKCRLLFKAGVTKKDLTREFGGATSTMTRVLENSYAIKDEEENDLTTARQDPSFQARLDHLGWVDPTRHQSVQHHDRRTGEEVKQEPQSPGAMLRKPTPRDTSGSPPPTANPHSPAPEQEDFLLTFLTRISFKNLYRPLKANGVDKDALYRMARWDAKRLGEFMARLVPEMSGFNRHALSDEIHKSRQQECRHGQIFIDILVGHPALRANRSTSRRKVSISVRSSSVPLETLDVAPLTDAVDTGETSSIVIPVLTGPSLRPRDFRAGNEGDGSGLAISDIVELGWYVWYGIGWGVASTDSALTVVCGDVEKSRVRRGGSGPQHQRLPRPLWRLRGFWQAN
ncbi:hypothetical protein B0H11DRAFT_2433187, partial [Mycena galericulata]